MSISDWINPVTLKELRQLVRSKIVAAGLIGFLTVSLVTVSIVLLSSRSELRQGISLGEQGLGKAVFISIYVILAILLVFATPFFIGFRMGAERSNEHLDLQYTTALKPRQLVDGKVTASVILILLFASAALPFLSLAYLLRGLDIFQALAATLMLILVAVACVFEALFLASAATSRVFRVLLVLALLSFQPSLVMGAIGVGVAMVEMGGFSLATWSDAITPALFVAGWLSVCLLLRAAITALVMPAAANRACSVRSWLSGLWLFWGLIAGIAAWRTGAITSVMIWALISIILFALFSAVAISSAPGYSRRVLGEISRRRWKRLVQFPFFSGAENGLLWALGMGGLTLLVALGLEMLQDVGGLSNDGPDAIQLVGFFFTLIAYVWTVRAVWRFGLGRWITYRLAGVMAGVLVLLGWGLPYLVVLGSPTQTAAWHFGNAFAVFDNDLPDIASVTGAAALWALLAFAINIPRLIAALRQFTPRGPVIAISRPSGTSGPTNAPVPLVARNVPDREPDRTSNRPSGTSGPTKTSGPTQAIRYDP